MCEDNLFSLLIFYVCFIVFFSTLDASFSITLLFLHEEQFLIVLRLHSLREDCLLVSYLVKLFYGLRAIDLF